MKRAAIAVVVAALLVLGALWALWQARAEATERVADVGAPAASGGVVDEPTAPRADAQQADAPSREDTPDDVRTNEPAAPEPPRDGGAPVTAAGRSPARGGVLVDEGSRSAPAESAPQASLDREAVRRGIKAATPRIRDCYDRALKHDPALAGRVVVEFHIEGGADGGGVVTSGEVIESGTQSPFFEACVLKEVAGATFDAPEGGGAVTVRYPFQFANEPAP